MTMISHTQITSNTDKDTEKNIIVGNDNREEGIQSQEGHSTSEVTTCILIFDSPLQVLDHVPIALLVTLKQGLRAAWNCTTPWHGKAPQRHPWQPREARPKQQR